MVVAPGRWRSGVEQNNWGSALDNDDSENPAPPRAASSGILTRLDLARVLGVHPQTVWGWVRDGLPTVQRGHSGAGAPGLFDIREVRRWLAARPSSRARIFAGEPTRAGELVSKKPAKHGQHWTKKDTQQIGILARKGVDTDDIAGRLGRTKTAIYSRAFAENISVRPKDKPNR